MSFKVVALPERKYLVFLLEQNASAERFVGALTMYTHVR